MRARVRHSARAALACVAVAASVSAGSAVAGQARGAAPVTSYNDASGDGNGAPDLTGVTVSNDAAGAITMRITVPNRPQLVSTDVIGVWIDADRNELTGP